MSFMSELCYDYDKEKVDNLFIEYKNGNKELESELIRYNYTLVKNIVNKINIYNYYDTQELESEALIGLIYAIRNYNPSLGYSFSSYATPCIKNRVYYCINRFMSNPNEISLNSLVFGTDDLTMEEMITSEEDFFANYLQQDYIDSLFLNIPLKHRDIAYKYYIENYSVNDLIKKYSYSQNQIRLILTKSKNILLKVIEENKLSDEKIIINRFNELDDKTRTCLLLYIKGYTYNEIREKIKNHNITYLLNKAKEHIKYPIEQIKEVLLNNDLSKKEDPQKEIFILNGILNLSDIKRKCLILSLKGYSLNEIAEILNQTYDNVTANIYRSLKVVGYNKVEIKDVLIKYNILDNYTISDKKTIDLAKLFFKDFENLSKEYINEVIDKFYKLPKEEQDLIIDYINKVSNDELASKYNLKNAANIKANMKHKLSKIGTTKEEIRYCLAKHI